MICAQCGKDNVDENKFCSACGAKLPEAEEAAPEISLDTPASDILDGGSADVASEDVSVDSLNDSVSDIEENVTGAAADMEDTVDNAFEEMKGDAGSSDYEESSYSSSDIYDDTQGGKPGFAIASLVCGCLSILCCCFGCCGFPVPVAAIVLGVMVIVKNLEGRSLAIAGIATGGVGLLLELIFTIAMASSDSMSDIFGALGI